MADSRRWRDRNEDGGNLRPIVVVEQRRTWFISAEQTRVGKYRGNELAHVGAPGGGAKMLTGHREQKDDPYVRVAYPVMWK